jgi:hypothetical protein
VVQDDGGHRCVNHEGRICSLTANKEFAGADEIDKRDRQP